MINSPKVYSFAIGILTMTLVSCSSGLRESETIASKMSRYNAKNEAGTSVPELTVLSPKSGRSPASVATGDESYDFGAPGSDQTTDRSSYSNRNLYYVTLLSQYQRLRRFASAHTDDINSCPSFHTMQLEYLEDGGKVTKSVRKQWSKEISLQQLHDQSYLMAYPELFLPVVRDSASPKVVDLLRGRSPGNDNFVQGTVQKALDIHIEKTYQELAQLCEKGVSTNYYNFENLITHVKRSTDFTPSSKNLQVLFKTSVFVNMALIDSMLPEDGLVAPRKKGRSIASQEAFSAGRSYERQVIKRLRVPWVGSYLKQLH